MTFRACVGGEMEGFVHFLKKGLRVFFKFFNVIGIFRQSFDFSRKLLYVALLSNRSCQHEIYPSKFKRNHFEGKLHFNKYMYEYQRRPRPALPRV